MHQQQWLAVIEELGGFEEQFPIPNSTPTDHEATEHSYYFLNTSLDEPTPEGRWTSGPSLDGRSEFKVVDKVASRWARNRTSARRRRAAGRSPSRSSCSARRHGRPAACAASAGRGRIARPARMAPRGRVAACRAGAWRLAARARAAWRGRGRLGGRTCRAGAWGLAARARGDLPRGRVGTCRAGATGLAVGSVRARVGSPCGRRGGRAGACRLAVRAPWGACGRVGTCRAGAWGLAARARGDTLPCWRVRACRGLACGRVGTRWLRGAVASFHHGATCTTVSFGFATSAALHEPKERQRAQTSGCAPSRPT